MISAYQKFSGLFASCLHHAARSVGQCWLCGQPCPDVCGCCRTCFTDLPRPPPRNMRPAQSPDYCHTWLAALYYQAPVETWIRRFKFHAQPMLYRPFAILIAAQVLAYHRQQKSPLPDYVTSIPMSFRRWQGRGFNQAELLAKEVGLLLGIRCKRVLVLQSPQLAQRTSQHQLNRTMRMANMTGAYRACIQIECGHWAVVDDIITTGATVTSAAQALLAAGADQVSGWALAYTPAES